MDKFTKEDLELIQKIENQARDMQFKYRGCSQASLLALQENLKIGDTTSFKAAGALATGIAGKGVGPCGALIGGMMAIGIEFGRAAVEEAGGPREGGESNYTRTFKLCGELYDKFKEYYKGDVSCWHIQEIFYEKLKLHPELGPEPYYNSACPEMQPLKETGEFYNILAEKACHVVAVGARLAAEIILRERKVDAEKGKHVF